MKGCNGRYHSEIKIHNAIKNVSKNIPEAIVQIQDLIERHNFENYLKEKGIDLTDPKLSKAANIRKHLKSFLKQHSFSVQWQSKIENKTSKFGYTSALAQQQAIQGTAITIAEVSYDLKRKGDEKWNDLAYVLKHVRNKMYNDIRAKLLAQPEFEKGNKYYNGLIKCETDKDKNGAYAIIETAGGVLFGDSAVNFMRSIRNLETNQEFRDQVLYNPILGSLKTGEFDLFNEELSLDVVEETDEDTVNPAETDSVDEMSKSWDGALKKDVAKTFDEEIKMYLNTLPRLNTTAKDNNGNYIDFVINEAGFKEYLNAPKAIIELIDLANKKENYKSLPEFIAGIEKLAETKPLYKGFMKLVDDMRRDENFAIKVFKNANQHIVRKVQLAVNENGEVSVHYSNSDSQSHVRFVNLMRSGFSNIIKEVTHSTAVAELSSIYIKPSETELTDEQKLNYYKVAKTYFSTYLPNIPISTFDNYVTNNTEDIDLDNLRTMISLLSSIAVQAEKSYTIYQDEYDKQTPFRIKKAKQDKEIEIAAHEGRIITAKPINIPPITDAYLRNMEQTFAAVAKHLTPYSDVAPNLNHYTVKGTKQTDVIPHNFLTFLSRIMSDKEALKKYGEEILKGNEHRFSNILLSNDGSYGIFSKQGNELFINKTNLLKLYLLDGIRNSASQSADYKTMSDSDYYRFALELFEKGIPTYDEHLEEDGLTDDKLMPVIVTIPSDAPKTFVVTMPKYNIGGLFTVNSEALTSEIRPFVDAVADATFKPEYTIPASVNIKDIVQAIVNNTSFTIKASEVLEEPHNNQLVRYIPIHSEDNRNKVFIGGTFTKKGDKYEVTNLHVINNVGMAKEFYEPFEEAYGNKFAEKHALINHTHDIFKAITNIAKDDIFSYLKAEVDLARVEKGLLSADRLIKNYHTGKKNAFSLRQLMPVGKSNPAKELKAVIDKHLSTGGLSLIGYSTNAEQTDFSGADLKISKEALADIEAVVENWIKEYAEYSVKTAQEKWIKEEDNVSTTTIEAFSFNHYIHQDSLNKILNGKEEFYKDTQTAVKRSKQVQAGGKAYLNEDLNHDFARGVEDSTGKIVPIYRKNPNTGKDTGIKTGEKHVTKEYDGKAISLNGEAITLPNGKPLMIRSGWNGITIHNSVRKSLYIDNLRERLKQANVPEKSIERLIDGMSEETITNDAQSYITIWEYIRRLKLQGEYNKYAKLISQLLDETPVEEIDATELNAFVQVQKNFYFDHKYNADFGMHTPRQIKNAELVLIPKFIQGSELETMYNLMMEYDIDQVNTIETSKAVNTEVLTLFDNNKVITEENLVKFRERASFAKEAFKYMFLYKQQDVPQHMVDEKNKAGIQIMKKIIDNTFHKEGEIGDARTRIISNYVENIRQDFISLMEKFGAKINPDGSFDLDNVTVDFGKVYDAALKEASRLGLDSNMIDYFKSSDGTIIPDMPIWANLSASKIESIAQSQFNRNVTRQKLNGFHAAQVSNVGFGGIISKYRAKNDETFTLDDGSKRTLRYMVDDGNGKPVIEILLPKWAKQMFNQYDENGNLIREYDIKDLDDEVLQMIGYRIPTEAKQSIAVMQVVGFLPDAMGSTIVVPDEWVTQTGSDFDVDSVYGISHNIYRYVDKQGNHRIGKVKFSHEQTPEATWKRYINYVNSLTNKRIADEIPTHISYEKIKEYKQQVRAKIKQANVDITKGFEAKIKDLISQDKTIYEQFPDVVKEALNNIFKDGSLTYAQKVDDVIALIENTLNHEAGKEHSSAEEKVLRDLTAFQSLYNEIGKTIREQKEFIRAQENSVYEAISNMKDNTYRQAILARAEAVDALSFDDFAKQSVYAQNTREARENEIIRGMIDVMQNPASLQEILAKSNFDDIMEANKIVSEYKGENSANDNLRDFATQVKYRRNSVGGLELKARSVSLDNISSVLGAAKGLLPRPIAVYYANEEHEANGKAAFGHVTTKGKTYITHDKIGWSNNNNLNILGNNINADSSHTTAHILDAVKMGAIENETTYTFSTYKLLFNLGVPAITAIAWIRQSGISRIVKAQSAVEGMFNPAIGNPINAAIREIAIELGIKVKGQDITVYTNPKDVLAAIFDKHKDFIENKYGANALFANRDSYGNGTTAGTLFAIDVLEMITSLRGQFTDNTERLIHDLVTVLQFSQFKTQADLVDRYAMVLNPDKFGAKQTIYETREKINTIAELTKDDLDGKPSIKTADGKNVLQAIYVGASIDEKNRFHYENYLKGNNAESAYPTLDAFLRYSTVPSILINKQLIDTENDIFVEAISALESFAGVKMNKQLYNQFKSYVIDFLFKTNSEFITYPITLNANNEVEVITELSKGKSPVEEESSRLRGIQSVSIRDFRISDNIAPTQEDINAFAKLTPAQKLMYLKAHLKNTDVTIFDYIGEDHSNRFNNKLVKLSYKEDIAHQETIYKLFEEAYNTSNPLIKLAMMDLIKYAFSVEGYSFKKGSISKIIPNSVIKGNRSDTSTGVIADVTGKLHHINRGYLSDGNVYETFIRSNWRSMKLPKINIGTKQSRVTSKPNVGLGGMITFNTNDDINYLVSTGIFKKSKFAVSGAAQVYGIEVNKPYVIVNTMRNGKFTPILHKVAADFQGGLYFYPLDDLEANEHSTFSYSDENKHYFAPAFYKEIINKGLLSVSLNELKTEHAPKKSETVINENGIQLDGTILQKIIYSNDAVRKKLEPFIVDGNRSERTAYVVNAELENAFQSLNVGSLQNVTIDGINYEVLIRRVKINRPKTEHWLRKEDQAVQDFFADENMKSSSDFYKISVVGKTNNNYNENEIGDETGEYYSAIDDFVGDENLDSDISALGEIAHRAALDIKREGRRTKGMLEKNTIEAIEEYAPKFNAIDYFEAHKDNIIDKVVEYYVSKANQLEKLINNYEYNGKTYNISDIELIKAVAQDPVELDRYMMSILSLSNFGTRFEGIEPFIEDIENDDVREIFRKIKNNISKIENNPNIKKAFINVMQHVYAVDSNNPFLKNGLLNINDIPAKDISKLFYLVQDAQETGMPIIQIIYNKVKKQYNVRQFEAKDAVREFQNKEKTIREEAAKRGETIDIDKIIDKATKRFQKEYSDDLFKDYNALKDNVIKQKALHGENSIEHLEAVLARNKFTAKNFHFELVPEYYNAKNKITETLLGHYAGDQRKAVAERFARYKQLKARRAKIYANMKIADNTVIADYQAELALIREQLDDLMAEERENMTFEQQVASIELEDDETGDFNSPYFEEENFNKLISVGRYLDAYEYGMQSLYKEYYVSQASDYFKVNYDKYNAIINKYKKYTPFGEALHTEAELSVIPEYVEAREWLDANTYDISNNEEDDLRRKVFRTLKDLRGDKSATKNADYKDIIAKLKADKVRYIDSKGNLIGQAFSEEEARRIKEEQEKQFGTLFQFDDSGETKLLRSAQRDAKVYSPAFYALFKRNLPTDVVKARSKIIANINNILRYAFDDDGYIKLSKLNEEQLNTLADLYKELDATTEGLETNKELAEKLKFEVETKTDEVTYAEDENNARLKGGSYFIAWSRVAQVDAEKDGVATRVPNNKFYGILTAKNEKKYLDVRRTKALEIVRKHLDDSPTTYYYTKLREMQNKPREEFDKWYNDNHVYDPNKKRFVPIRIWTQSVFVNHKNVSTNLDGEANINIKDENFYARIATPNNKKSYPKKDKINPDYNEYANKYNSSTGDYTTALNLNRGERELLNHYIATIQNVPAISDKMRKFIHSGAIPAMAKKDESFGALAKETLNAFGLGGDVGKRIDPKSKFGYTYDRAVESDMTKMLGGDLIKEVPNRPIQGLTEKPEDYAKRIDKWRKQVDEINEYNRKLHASLMEDNYSYLIENFISEAYNILAKEEAKTHLYYAKDLLEKGYYKVNETNPFNDLKKDGLQSTEERIVYKTSKAYNTIDQLNIWGKRFVFDEYRPQSPFAKLAITLQNITSAKYMMGNITGGIANILMGESNIMLERFAGEFASHKDFYEAKYKYYFPALASIIANAYNDEATNLVDGIIKEFNIVDYNNFTFTENANSKIDKINKIRDLAYTPQTAGEHYMQNTFLLTMMINHRVMEVDGKYQIVSLADMTNNKEIEIFRNLIKDDDKLLKEFNAFVKSISRDKNELKEYTHFRKNFVTEFLTTHRDAKLINDFVKAKEDYKKNLEADFETNPRLIDLFELKNGRAVLKENANIDYKQLAEFKEKVVSVNKKIHGVYDKLGGATIETTYVFGALITQYHKHIAIGLAKRFNRNGYFNESRKTVEKGFYGSIVDFLSLSFRGAIKKTENNPELNGYLTTMEAIQNYMKVSIDIITNAKLTWDTLSDYDKANIKRAIGEIATVAGFLVGGILAFMLKGSLGDDDKNNKLARWAADMAIYQMDRLNSETIAFNIGAISESKKLWSNPVAVMGTVKDALSAFGFISEFLIQGEDFNPIYTTGSNAGKNKLHVYIERNIPVYRTISRAINIGDNNKYYKVGSNTMGIFGAKDIAEDLIDEEDD